MLSSSNIDPKQCGLVAEDELIFVFVDGGGEGDGLLVDGLEFEGLFLVGGLEGEMTDAIAED